MMAQTNLPAEGHVGIEPPPDAPREVAQPVSAEFMADAAAKARMNERMLAPLTYLQKGPIVGAETSHEVQEPPPVKEAPGQSHEPMRPSKYVTPTVESDFPAASNTDGPSRGLPGTAPIPSARKNAPLGVTGGFGEAGGEYYPLNGREVKALVETFLDQIFEQIQNDMNFGVARTFPRIDARLTLEINCAEQDKPLVITKLRREFNQRDESETPPDAIRDELKLPRPRKQKMGGPAGQFADVTW